MGRLSHTRFYNWLICHQTFRLFLQQMIVVNKEILVIRMQVTRSNHWFFTGHSWWSLEFQVKNLPCNKENSCSILHKSRVHPCFCFWSLSYSSLRKNRGRKIPHEVEQLSPGTAKTEAAYSRAPMPWWKVLYDAMKIPWSTTKTHWSQINKQIFFKNILILLPLDI